MGKIVNFEQEQMARNPEFQALNARSIAAEKLFRMVADEAPRAAIRIQLDTVNAVLERH